MHVKQFISITILNSHSSWIKFMNCNKIPEKDPRKQRSRHLSVHISIEYPTLIYINKPFSIYFNGSTEISLSVEYLSLMPRLKEAYGGNKLIFIINFLELCKNCWFSESQVKYLSNNPSFFHSPSHVSHSKFIL